MPPNSKTRCGRRSMRDIRELLGLTAPLAGLEAILDRVANGQLTTSDAAVEIRGLVASKPHIPQWFPRLFRIMGAMFAIVGIGVGCYSIAFAIGADEVQGTVTNMVRGSPVVDYEVNGKQFTFQSSVSSTPPAYFVGEKVRVLYRPDNPASAQINSFTDQWLLPIGFTFGGAWAITCSYLFPRWISFLTGATSGKS